MSGYFDAMPQSSLHMGRVLKWVQEQTNTFYRSITMRGELFSANWVDGTSGWKLFADGSAQFNGDVAVGGESSTTTQLFIDNTGAHLNLRETDAVDYPDHTLIYGISSGVGVFSWKDDSVEPSTFTEVIRMSQNGLLQVETGPLVVTDGAAATPAIRREAQETGLFFGDGHLGVSVSAAEVARFTANGLRGITAGIDSDANTATFTNTTYLDLDAITGGTTLTAVAATLTTGASAIVWVSSLLNNTNAGATTRVSYRVSGDSTIAASDNWALIYESGNANDQAQMTFMSHQTGLTPGSNTFEVQARVSAGTGGIGRVYLTVIPL